MKRVENGFTLLEVLLAVALLAGGTVAVAELFQTAQWGSTEAENALIATQLTQARLEELRNTAYASLANETKASISSPSGFSRFSREVTVTTPYTNLKLIVVTVYWTGTGGETNVSLSTYRSAV
ncbi:MAG: prepilin-type N-terminal cleavage/methylation domain-containing protein [Candidatus Omnitrophica bacterium]|nr:prepilin-type N-terminal cleavage/methylation domain-containing protein [Candidatus Omnitrophota bacterium]